MRHKPSMQRASQASIAIKIVWHWEIYYIDTNIHHKLVENIFIKKFILFIVIIIKILKNDYHKKLKPGHLILINIYV